MSALGQHLMAAPATWLAATLLAYRAACALYARLRCHPLAHPVALSVALLAALLGASGTPYPTYFAGAQWIHFLLGPATVALAIPLYQQLHIIRHDWFALLCGALAGGATAIAGAMAVAALLGASHVTVLSMAAKSVSMPIAMGVTEKIGGLASLTSALVLLTGVLGAAVAPAILARMRIDDERTRGFVLGVVAHGIGTARAFQGSQQMGAFAGLAMGLSGVLTALALPYALKLLDLL